MLACLHDVEWSGIESETVVRSKLVMFLLNVVVVVVCDYNSIIMLH